MNKIKINTESIKLDQFLKLSSIVNSGAEAKFYIKEGLVYLNDEICLQRGKKIKKGDLIKVIVDEYDDESLEIEFFEII